MVFFSRQETIADQYWEGFSLSSAAKHLMQILKPIIPRRLLDKRRLLLCKREANKAGLHLKLSDHYFDLEKGDKVLRISASHAIYLPHMIENFDYYIDSVIPVRDGERYVIDMSGPRYHRLKGFGDVPFMFPSHTEPYGTTQEYLEFADLKQGQTVLDIGAYSGVTSIIFAQRVGPTGHVYAFEADEMNYECAKINVEMAKHAMGLDNITLLHKAIWSHNDGVLFSNEGAMGSSAVAITGGGRGKERLVASTTLSSFLVDMNLKQVDFIKVDIEGGEVELLKSSADSLRSINAKLIVEPHWVNGRLSTEECSRFLNAAGFSVRARDKVGESEPLIEAVPKT